MWPVVTVWTMNFRHPSASKVDRPCRKPYWLLAIAPLPVRWSLNLKTTSFSSNLPHPSRRQIGRYAAGICRGFPGFRMSTKLPFFYRFDNCPSSRHLLKTLWKVCGFHETATFKISLVTLSGPGAFFSRQRHGSRDDFTYKEGSQGLVNP